MSQLALYLLGPPRVEIDGEEIHIPRRKAVALLIYLAVSGRSHSRDSLATLLWPELDQSTARTRLRRALATLKEAIGDGRLDADRDTIGLNSDAEVWLDVGAFHDRLAVCEAHDHPPSETCPDCVPLLKEAVALYRDHFLAGFTLRDSAAFDDWQFFQTESLKDQLAVALVRLATCHTFQGDLEPAIAHVRRWLALDPLHEPAHRHLMALYAHSGQRAAALRQYQLCEQTLFEELGLPPSEETKALYEQIRTQPADRAEPVTPIPRGRHNLPFQPTPFVGREALLAEIKDRLQDPACRLLTLVGPGGSGKTRLALEAAAAQLDNYPHGVYFVSLAPLDSADAIVPTVAKALDFSFYAEAGGSAQDRLRQRVPAQQQLLDYLHPKGMLLIMDNFEHLLEDTGLVTEILRTAPGVKILATSRARLSVGGEHRLRIAGMNYPDEETAGERSETFAQQWEDVAEYSAVKLFLQGACRAQPGYELTDENLNGVVQVCRLVDGLPLGIRLAAAWVEMLTPAEIAVEIGQSLDFLETELRDVPARQRSIRAAFDHSYHLLSEREREVFQRLSVFRGSFTRDAAHRVTGGSLRELRALVDKSLLERDPSGRYDFHELLRQYAEERLGEVPAEKGTAQDRHCAYYAQLLHTREADLIGKHQREALVEIEAEIENVRAAWNWAVDQGRIEEIDRSLESLAEFYRIRAWFREGEQTFARAAQRLAGEQSDIESRPEVGRESKIVLGKVQTQQGRFCDPLGLAEKGVELFRRGLAIFRDLGARREMAFALYYLGEKPLCQEALAIFREIGDRRGIALSLRELADVRAGEYGAARQLYQESLAIFRGLGNQEEIATSLCLLGWVAWLLGECEVAKELHQESLVLYREIGDQSGVANSLGHLGIDALHGFREYEEAKRLFQESLAIYEEIGNLYGVGVALSQLGGLADVQGEYAEAIQLAQRSLALAEKCRDATQMPVCLRILGRAACGLGDLKGAKAYFRRALESAMTERAIPWLLDTFNGIAMLLAREGERERALELLTFALYHPACAPLMRDRDAPLVAELEAELPPDVAAAAQERGRARDLGATVAELLIELGE